MPRYNNEVHSIDIFAAKEYNYEYEEGRIVRANELDITLSGELVIGKSLLNTVKYYYNADGTMYKKTVTPVNGSIHTINYETANDNTVVSFSAGGRTVRCHSKTDSFGRKEFDEIQLGQGSVSRQFTYHAGEVTDTHQENGKVKSEATTSLVSKITLSNGTALSYSYDAEERISSVVETYTVNNTPVTNTTLYTYDALGQLLTETVNGVLVNSMEYDNYGNIIKKNGKAYTYGDVNWKDLLTSYNGQSITYDAQGNPTSYLGHTLTWEKGRQLKKFDNIEYTYNANGIRTSKKVNGVLHTYTLDGTKILREVWGGNTLIPLYDNEDGVCGILYNSVPYYFIKNLQGDVIAIVDKDAQTVARYSYDAWGKILSTTNATGTDISGIPSHIANINPFRYRGYYYAEEIELYYLQSRYYDAGVGRFINADEVLFGIYLADRIISLNLFAYADNSAAINIDNNGFSTLAAYAVSSTLYSEMLAMSVAATSLMVSIKAFLAMLWNIFVVVALLLIAIAAIIYICKTIGNVHSTIQAKINVSKDKYKEFKNTICVYVLASKERNINSIFYVGRTKNISARFNAHQNDKNKKPFAPFYMYVVYTCTSVAQSRVVEQCVLAGCLTGKFTSIIFGSSPSNKIKGISAKKAKKAIKNLGKEKKATISLLGCTKESDLLFMMNQ